MNFTEAYRQLNGCDPGADDVLRFERLVTALDTKPNGALLAVLVALDHYETLYCEIPKRISESALDALNSFKDASDKQAIQSMEAAKADLAKAVAEIAQQVARDVATKSKWQWAAACIVVAFLFVSLVIWYAHSTGERDGYNSGYGVGISEAKDEKAAAAWANTPEGHMAFRLAQVVSVEKLIRCDQPGWYVEKGVCYVKRARDGSLYGWVLPR